ncbi:MAG: hypothetical protein II123_05530 [Lachnospiraceae bacterium]|nr:hypothetical protein [Lachnospiraceae bacterium]
MSVQDILENVKREAKSDEAFRLSLLATASQPEALEKFCKLCREHGHEIYAIDVVLAGEESYAAMRRSTNGGGENSPLLQGEDDLYEMFLMELK